MTTTSILEVIQHYQRSIEKCQDDETRLLHCINKLYKLPVKVEHLQETGIGKTVNSLRKFSGEIGVAAKALVTKWKAMVAAEEDPKEVEYETVSADHTNSKGYGGSSDDEQYDQNANNASPLKGSEDIHCSRDKEKVKHKGSRSGEHSENAHQREKSHGSGYEKQSKPKSSSSRSGESSATEKHHKHRERDEKTESKRRDAGEQEKERERKEKRHEDKHKGEGERKSTHDHKSDKSDRHHRTPKEEKHKESGKGTDRHGSSGKSKEMKREKDRTSAKDEDKDSDHRHKNKVSSTLSASSSSSSSKPSTSAAVAATVDGASLPERKRRHNSDNESSEEVLAAKAKAPKVSKSSAEGDVKPEGEGDFDSSMGANFADVLGMLNMPTKKSKKSHNSGKSPTLGAGASNGASTSSSSTSNCNRSNSSRDNTRSATSTSKSYTDKAAPSSSTAATMKRVSPDQKPDLLSASAKLDPLDPSIALALPTISTNYRPMPLNQTVMDCVFNNGCSRAPVRTLTDAEALSHGISSKTMRTKIYSGVRTGQILQVPSLFDLCIRVLQKNIDALEYTGGVPFEVLRPVIERATPQQLLIFEEYNPYLMEDSDSLWQLHVQRNYRAQKRQEMESWREMFLRCQEDQERKLNILAESIKQSQKIIAAPVRKTQLAFVDSLAKPPRNVQRKQEQYGTKSKLIATPAARVAALSSVTPNAAKTGDARLRVAASVRDAAQVSHSAVRPKKAPLMAKTLQFMRGRHKR